MIIRRLPPEKMKAPAVSQGSRQSLGHLDGSGHFAGAQAAGADVKPFGAAVDTSFNPLYIGFPLTIGPYMGMAVFFAEADAFAADIAFGHFHVPPLF